MQWTRLVNKKEKAPMSQQENPERTNQAVEVEDLAVKESQQQGVKGGNRVIVPTGSVTFFDNTY
jgi:hypothetical protein